ncbi:hypothetical protein LG3211_0036 [Lysobacter gummosus]|nr:hypothetical protein LG3211_0036 [Lysobacter gummosus]
MQVHDRAHAADAGTNQWFIGGASRYRDREWRDSGAAAKRHAIAIEIAASARHIKNGAEIGPPPRRGASCDAVALKA